ncbi:MAG: hypothetical protein ABJ246_16055 [Paracoccaceae bacterium]
MEAGRDAVLNAMQGYGPRAQANELHLLAPHLDIAGAVTKSDMEYLYTGGMLKVGAGRHIYDAIMGLAPNSRCPYCGHRRVRQLDHFLPKSKYPSFSVAPLNLVPSCSDCNKDKLDGDANRLTDLPLHPYFDYIDNACWLKADVVQVPGSVFLFEVDTNCGLPATDMQRLQSQFNKLDLDELYTTEANDELASIRLNLRKQHAIDGAASVREYLQGEFESAQDHRLNAWKTAFYRAACQNDWFCNGGFDDPELP